MSRPRIVKQCEVCRHEFNARRESHTRCDECFRNKQTERAYSWSVPLDANDIRSIWSAWRQGRLDAQRKAFFFDLIERTAKSVDNRARDYALQAIVYIGEYEYRGASPGGLGAAYRKNH